MKQTEWVELVARWRASRQSARQFAAAHGVTDTALRYWAGRLAGGENRATAMSRQRPPVPPAAPTTPLPSLARVVRPGEPLPVQGDGRVMVVVGKATIVVESGFDTAHLRDVVRALSDVG